MIICLNRQIMANILASTGGTRNAKGQGNFFTANDGSTFNLPDLHGYEEKIAHLQRCLSRKQKGSNAYAKARTKLSNYVERVQNIKKDAQNKLVHELVNTYSHIAVEHLSTKSMVRKAKKEKAKRRAILRYSNYDIRIAIERKAFDFRMTPKYFASSQICSNCGTVHIEMKDDKIRTLKCSCGGGFVIDRDLNAAINILNKVFKAQLAKNK